MKKHPGFLTIYAVLLLGIPMLCAYAQDAVRTGEITKLDPAIKSFVIKTAMSETNILTTDSTVIREGDKTLKYADLKTGDFVKVTGVRKGTDVEAKEIEKQAKP